MNVSLIVDIIIFGLIAILIIVNTLYGIGLLIFWIWHKLKRKDKNET